MVGTNADPNTRCSLNSMVPPPFAAYVLASSFLLHGMPRIRILSVTGEFLQVGSYHPTWGLLKLTLGA
jgi:hypothetical protein